MKRPWSILVRCDGAPAIGFGHVVRSLALARELVDRNAAVTFAMREGPLGMALAESEGYRVVSSHSAGTPDDNLWLDDCVIRSHADALVLDVRDDLTRPAVERIRSRGVVVATIDDSSDRRLAADLAFHPPVPQVDAFDWTGFTGARLIGTEWVILRRVFANAPMRAGRSLPTVLVTMGGSDPAGMTLTTVDSLSRMTGAFDLVVVLGPGYGGRHALDELLARHRRRATVLEQPADMRAVMLGADLAVASFGVTAYELAATATPAIYLCLTADHAQSASLFDVSGAAITLGIYSDVEGARLAETVIALLEDTNRLAAMGRAGRALVDGQGAGRVADRIVAALEERHATESS